LKYFVRIVDVGNITLASDVLYVAQPSLSQHIATLEAEFNQQLLIRTAKGVTPTEAGKIFYRHAQAILKQYEQAHAEVGSVSTALQGKVSVGLAPGTAASRLALPLLKTVRNQFPEIVLHVNESFGTTLVDLISDGRMDMAVLYAQKPISGLSFMPLLQEELILVTPAAAGASQSPISLCEVAEMGLLMLRPPNEIRRLLDEAFRSADLRPRVVAEIESIPTLINAVTSGIGGTILPLSAARLIVESCPSSNLRRFSEPITSVPLSLCTSDSSTMTPSAQAIRSTLIELAEDLAPTIGARQILEHEEIEWPSISKR
jgi:LysR family nitrogen assimilation transcriptional regulator